MSALNITTSPLHFLLLYSLPLVALVHSALVAYHNRKRSRGAMFFFAAISMTGAGLIISNVTDLDYGDYLPGYVFSYGLLIALGHSFAKREDAGAANRLSSIAVAGGAGASTPDFIEDHAAFLSNQTAQMSRQTDPAYYFMADNIHNTTQDHWLYNPTENWRPENNHHIE